MLEFTSKEGVEVTMGGNTDSDVLEVGAFVDVKFNRENAVFLEVGEHSVRQIKH